MDNCNEVTNDRQKVHRHAPHKGAIILNIPFLLSMFFISKFNGQIEVKAKAFDHNHNIRNNIG